MLALRIADTKDFMTKLLAGDTFDTFLFSEGSVTTFTTFTIDGTWHPEFFGREEHTLTWSLVRPIVFDMIKGKHTPIQLRIVLKLAEHNVESLLARSALSVTREQVHGLFLNITYTKEEVTITTGTSLRIFTLDKSVDHVWDDMIRRFLDTRGIRTKQSTSDSF